MIKFIKKYLPIFTILFLSVNTYAVENNQDIVSLLKPTTVHIVSSVKGDIGIPNFVLDYETGIFSTTTKVNGFSSTTLDKSTESTGFIISPDGILVTSSSLLNKEINNIYHDIAKKYLLSINKNKQDKGYEKAYNSILNYLNKNSIINSNYEIKVLAPKGNSYIAEVLYSGIVLEKNDLAILKINAENLPSVDISDNTPSLGEKIYSIGFPLLDNTFSNPIFSQSIIKNIKDGQNQTDIDSFAGSIGSPVVDQYGLVVGVLVDSGSFISILPLKKVLQKENISIKKSLYRDYYLLGLFFAEQNYCKKAIEQFTKAENLNQDFSVDEFIKSKIDFCNNIILTGKSRDNFLSDFIYILKNNTQNSWLWFSLGGLIMLILIIYKSFLNRFRRDEQKINLILHEENIEVEDDIIIDTDKKTGKKTDQKIVTEFQVKPFETVVDLTPIDPSISKVKVIPIEKVEVTPRPESPQAPVTPPKAIQPDGPVVVITPFKTLSKPIRSSSTQSVEMKKDIKTDLPSKKKEDII